MNEKEQLKNNFVPINTDIKKYSPFVQTVFSIFGPTGILETVRVRGTLKLPISCVFCSSLKMDLKSSKMFVDRKKQYRITPSISKN